MKSHLKQLISAAAFSIALAAQGFAAQSPSTTVDPYITSHLPGVEITSILTVADGVTVPDTDGGTTRLVGIPDGIGAVDGPALGDTSDVFYLFVNHELNSTQGIARDHGEIGAFVSKWKVDKATLEVLEGDDLIKEFYDWNEGTQSFELSTATFNRMCSSDLPAPTALYNSVSGLGSQEVIYFNGEETSGGRAIGTVVTGADAGKSYHLEHLGFAAFENVLLNPVEQNKTIAMLTDDATNGEVYVYVGDKQATGAEVEKAGLVGGNLYAIAVPGKPFERDNIIAAEVGDVEPFTLGLLGSPGDRPIDGSDTTARGISAGTLKMGGPEDGAWDTRFGHENKFYFVTKGTGSNGLTAVTRLWQLEFSNIAMPELGGTMTLLLDGPANRLGSLDNMCFEVIGGQPKLYIQEDLGGSAVLSKIWEYDLSTGQLEEIAEHDGDTFYPGAPAYLTDNEESSGVISLKNILGEGVFASSIQVHTSLGLPDSSELVEYGQVLILDISGRGTDALREELIGSGDAWDFRVDGIDPGATWNEAGFIPDADWNKATDGTVLGASPSPLGYGEAPGALATDLVQPASPRAATYYFRKEFDLVDPNAIVLLDLFMKIDDGAVVYVNGVEVSRYNMNLDLNVGSATFASENEASERDWKYLPLNCEEVTFLPTGNVLAVSIHQENSGSSDMRIDAELFAWNATPDAGTAPVIPQNLATTNALEKSLDLTWDAQSDAKFFRIERQQAGDLAWEVIASEVPGTFTGLTDEDLESGATYNYRISAYNIHGASGCSTVASGATTESLLFVIFEELFENDLGQFTPVDVAASDRNFQWDDARDGVAEGNNFGGATGGTEDWLITTDPISFEFFRNEILIVEAEIDFGGPLPQILYSLDYDPAVNTDPNTATWVQIAELPTAGDPTEFTYDISDIPSRAYLAFQYTGLGPNGGESVRLRILDVLIAGDCGFDFEGAENSDIADDASNPWEVVNYNSAFGWIYDDRAGQQGAINNNFGSGVGGIDGGETSDDWLISPAFTSNDPSALIEFEYYENFGDTLPKPLTIFVTNNYTGDPRTTAWTEITPPGLDGSVPGNTWTPVSSLQFGITGSDMRIAFWYQSGGNSGGTTKRIGVDNICITSAPAELVAEFSFQQNGEAVTFAPSISGGIAPFTTEWNFGDGNTSTELAPTYAYSEKGTYTVSLTVTDAEGDVVVSEQIDIIVVTCFEIPETVGEIRVATYNTSMNRSAAGQLAADLAAGDSAQIAQVAEVIQRNNPDILLINEFDHVYTNGVYDAAATEQQVIDFMQNYLEVAQAEDTAPVYYDYFFVAPCNTGVPSGFDLDNNGSIGGGNDAYGFGFFPGQFAMVVLSKYYIKESQVRTFQNFLWKDMPGAFLPEDPNDSDSDGDFSSYYNADELEVFRLSSKSHWDIPVKVGNKDIHILASHPTPPVFDDGEAQQYPNAGIIDWNGLRNHDEIRFWADYINPAKSGYIYDDAEWAKKGTTPKNPQGGLKKKRRFIILGDQNADPVDGDATFNPIQLLLNNAGVDTSITPASDGALEQVAGGQTDRAEKTASFDLRADYALPSAFGLDLLQAYVYWPETTDFEFDLLDASDHCMVVIDLNVDQSNSGKK